MTISMTGFAAAKGQEGGFNWSWELRSVNSKGLDLRLRVPDWITGLEAGLRARLSETLTRGAVTLSLRLSRDEEIAQSAVNMAQLDAVLDALQTIEGRAQERGIALAPARAADLMSQRGVLESRSTDENTDPLKAALLKGFEPLLAEFMTMRANEGAALREVLLAQLESIATLTAQATTAAEARRAEQDAALKQALAKVLDGAAGVSQERVTQELALIAVKADITEELDRLGAHVQAARGLLESSGPIGRKFDFLSQEFNREANTLCSKSQSKQLTAIGLDLKAVIDQMREQIQNVE
ncbi:YicC/YloC family endoribonuclease [Aquicoccus sp. G2-2]|uniref:YicC/YloC family endoribonuclease n=1 Tax=Aquicoccus sp. G2-2 TaxID=3092120 RepID=UPI002ADFE338|nr:YicC/YloC family endoribonuclease [Aquicoccus sp. G2-2]MEA1113133.1 YicC/YloC family endoribonuclease [Aquicoccus sp. G2-2]